MLLPLSVTQVCTAVLKKRSLHMAKCVYSWPAHFKHGQSGNPVPQRWRYTVNLG